MRALFLTWDGPQQSYLESLFFPAFARLRELGVEIHVLQFSWATDEQLCRTRRAAAAFGVPYVSKLTSRRFGLAGNVAAIARGALLASSYARAHRLTFLFPRSLLPAGIALLASSHLREARIVFDADGLMADERIEFGGWSARGAPYRVLREIEARTLRKASAVITRTAQAKDILAARAGVGIDSDKIFVIPNAKDPTLFSPGSTETRARIRERFGIPERAPWLMYVGSFGPQYCPETMLELFGAISRRAPETRWQVFSYHEDSFRQLLLSRGSDRSASICVSRAEPSEVAACLSAADLGLALRQVTFSQRAVCPIKVAEYLQCGVPVVATRVGDLAAQIGSEDAASLLDGSSERDLDHAASWFVERVLPDRDGFRQRCRRLGEQVFGLDVCVQAYRRAFEYAEAARS